MGAPQGGVPAGGVETADHSGLPGGPLRKSHRNPPRRMQPQGQSQSPNDGPESHTATGNRPGIRVYQATARLTKAQKLKAELTRSSSRSSKRYKTISRRSELESAKRALIPSAPTTDPGSACITFSREQSAELQRVLLPCQKSMATDPEERERAKQRCNESHEAAGVTQEAAQEEINTAHKLAKLIGWVGEKLATTQPTSSCPTSCYTANPPDRQQCRCYHERCHSPPGNRPAHGTGPAGRGRQSGLGDVQSGISAGLHKAGRGNRHTHVNVCQGSKGLLAVCQGSKGLLVMLLCYFCIITCQEPYMPMVDNTVVDFPSMYDLVVR